MAALVLAGSSCKDRPPPPELGRVPAFTLRDQQGTRVTEHTVSKGAWALAFIFTRCPTVCPRVTRAMKQLQADAGDRGVELRLVSVSVDPEHDSPEVLREYAARFHANTSTWRFLTGDPSVVQELADGVKIALEGAANESAEHFGITHGSHLVLIDGKGTIRGYYGTSDPLDLQRLLEDAGRIESETSS